MKFFTHILGLLAFATTSVSMASSEPRVAQTSAPAEVRLAHISVTEIGDGPLVVLIPGLASPRAAWSPIAPELARDHRVILVQVNGFAGDDLGANGVPGVLPGIVEELATYLRTRGEGKAAIIGHSMGGLVGMILTRDHPEIVDGLMIVDSLPFFGMLFGPGATVDSVRPGAEQLRTALLDGSAPTEAPANMSNSEAGRARVSAWLRAADRRVVAQALYEDLLTDLRPTIGQVRSNRIHVVYAVPDGPMAPLAHALYRDAYQGLANLTLVPVQSSAHFVMLDQPQVFAGAVRDFLASRPSN